LPVGTGNRTSASRLHETCASNRTHTIADDVIDEKFENNTRSQHFMGKSKDATQETVLTNASKAISHFFLLLLIPEA
jgi:hypothetical protein